MKNIFKKFIIFVLVLFFTTTVLAEDQITEIAPPEIDTGEIIEIITPSEPQPEPTPEIVNIFIRNNDEVVYDDAINLPEAGIINIIDYGEISHEINSQSVLGLIYSLSQGTEASFVISNLQYYSSMNAFYLKCITLKNGEEFCDNWQYVVDGTTPWTGIDQTLILGGQSIGLYFGTPHKLILDKNEILEKESVNVNSYKYNYQDNTWETLVDINISVSIPNESDPWNPTIITENPVDENGQAIITISTEGTYTFGIKEDYSFPSYQLIVKKVGNSGGSSGGNNPAPTEFSIDKALSFLQINQEEDGSFSNSLYTDWVAIGISKTEGVPESFKNTIYDYLKNEKIQSSIVTDNERHTMALMALGIDPYKDTDTDYIKKITETFDGTQLGDSSLYNDDIFGLIVLSHAGYTKNDEIIKSIVSYIISKQNADGSWDSVDMTSAAIMALRNFENINEVDEAIEKAETYILDQQEVNGSFGNIFSTSWAIQALTLNNSYENEVEKAITYLTNEQKEDGSLGEGDISSRIWATAYAIPAVDKISWNEILESFEKDEPTDNFSSTEDEEVSIKEEIKDEEILKEIIVEFKEEKKITNYELQITNENKKEGKEIIASHELKISNENTLLASAVGSVLEIDKQTTLLIKIEQFFFVIWNFLINLLSLV